MCSITQPHAFLPRAQDVRKLLRWWLQALLRQAPCNKHLGEVWARAFKYGLF
jgi:hypothetical protein